ncbi:MAG: aminotransferase class V-fold PLP-dependent enzyme [Phycisphaerales bacterium]|nr:aminotransferase class V-fold PLP-dependent enzyme [Phycisphaerales bacterium]
MSRATEFSDSPPPECSASVRGAFGIDPEVVFLNHGSFGAVPAPVARAAEAWRVKIEARPIETIARRMTEELAHVKVRVGEYLGADPARIGFVTNATSGIGAVLRSIHWKPGDRIVISNQCYNAVRQAAHAYCERFGCEVVVVDLPLPLGDEAVIVDRFMSAVDARTRLVIVDHITSPTAIVLPVAAIARACRERAVRCLVDGAHAPGMIPLAIDAIGADWYTGNLHKWVCAAKGCAILVPSPETASFTHPETTSHFHGHGFAAEFDWQGTRDFAGLLAIPAAIDFVTASFSGGLMQHNHALAAWAHRSLCAAFKVEPLSPLDGSMIGSMAAVELPLAIAQRFKSAQLFQAALYERHHIEVPIIDWGGRWYVRVSAQAYNTAQDYVGLSGAVAVESGG